jgi:hypothetical protein
MTALWNRMAEYGWVAPCHPAHVPGETEPHRRRLMRAEIDAFVAREVYVLSRDELELVLDSFVQLEGIERKAHGEFLTRRLVLEAHDRMAAAAVCSGEIWRSLGDVVPAGQGLASSGP